MNVWCHLPTIFRQRRTLQIAGLLALCVAFITMLFLGVASTYAAPGVNKTISFQGRLLDPQGSPVPDGYYNVQFKIYQDGSGATAGNTDGTLLWTETHRNDEGIKGVVVKNGYMSVDLGSKTPFGTSIDWNQDTLWLSMNIAGSSSPCTTFGTAPCLADGEMLPMKRLTATPYSLNSAKLEGLGADGFIKNTTAQQTADFNITGTGLANTLQGNTSVIAPLFDRSNAGTLSIGSVNATSIEIGSATGNQSISIGTGTGDKTVAVGSTSGASSLLLQGGANGVAIETSGGFNVLNENSETMLSIGTDGEFYVAGEATFESGLTTNGSFIASSGNQIALQGGGLDLLTAVNDNGQARVSIGTSAASSYSLDVNGGANVSDSYAINGVSILDNSGLNFSGASTSTISSSSGQTLQLAGDGGVRIGDAEATGEPTLLTVDRSGTTPLATGDAVLGSMYYDTTIGKLQCYEADGWGACSSSPDTFVTLSPEYTNAVTNGTGVGDLSSDICSDTLNINDGSSEQPVVCGTNETYNFYNWTSTELTEQTKSIYVTYQLPANFKEFVAGSTSLAGRTDGTNAGVSYQVYKNTATGMVACGTEQSVSTGAQTTWQHITASGAADPANCTFAASDSLVFKINLTASNGANAYASTLGFAFSDD